MLKALQRVASAGKKINFTLSASAEVTEIRTWQSIPRLRLTTNIVNYIAYCFPLLASLTVGTQEGTNSASVAEAVEHPRGVELPRHGPDLQGR